MSAEFAKSERVVKCREMVVPERRPGARNRETHVLHKDDIWFVPSALVGFDRESTLLKTRRRNNRIYNLHRELDTSDVIDRQCRATTASNDQKKHTRLWRMEISYRITSQTLIFSAITHVSSILVSNIEKVTSRLEY